MAWRLELACQEAFQACQEQLAFPAQEAFQDILAFHACHAAACQDKLPTLADTAKVPGQAYPTVEQCYSPKVAVVARSNSL